MIRRFSAAAALVALGSMLGPVVAVAQCRPPATSHEARLLAFYEVPALFSMASAPEQLAPGALRIGAEAEPVGSPSATLTHPDYCYQNTTNNTKLAPLFGRPRLIVGLPLGFAVEGSYVPPVPLSHARATLGSVALSRIQILPFSNSRLTLMLRAHGTIGRIRGSITCPRASLQADAAGAACYGTEPSHDSFDPNSLGVEGALATRIGVIDAYVGGGANWLRPHFQAGFTDAVGNVDHTTIDVALIRAAVFAGATVHVRQNVAISGQLYTEPADGTTVRIGATYQVR